MYKPYADSTLKKMTKEDLIEYIRLVEHNWFSTEETLDRAASTNIAFVNKLIADGILSEHEVSERLKQAQKQVIRQSL